MAGSENLSVVVAIVDLSGALYWCGTPEASAKCVVPSPASGKTKTLLMTKSNET